MNSIKKISIVITILTTTYLNLNSQSISSPKDTVNISIPDTARSLIIKGTEKRTIKPDTISAVKGLKDSLKVKIDSVANMNEIDSSLIYTEPAYINITAEDSARSLKTLERDIDAILNNSALGRTSYGIAVYSLDNNRFYYVKNYDMALTPASTTKLFTAYTVLELNGGNHYVKTEAYSDDDLDDGVINGNIYIVGHGDCLLTVPDIEYLADKVKQSGVREIRGNVYADGSYFDPVTSRWEYSGDEDEVQAMPPVTALGLNMNTATVRVTSGGNPGAPLQAQALPTSDALKTTVTGRVRSGRRNVRILSRSLDTNFQNFTVSGTMAPNQTHSYQYVMLYPEMVVAGNFKERLEAGGIKVTGGIGVKALKNKKESNKLGTFGRPIFDFLEPLNKNSNNYIAEHLFKMIGACQGENENCAATAKATFRNMLDSLAVICDLCQLNDGSGLSRRNRLSPLALVRMLKMASLSDYGKKFESSLSIAGVDGTLRKRMTGTRAEGNLHAKTGTLRNVSALAGYVTTLDGEKLAFAFIFNGPGVYSYKQIENELGVLLSNFFYFNVRN